MSELASSSSRECPERSRRNNANRRTTLTLRNNVTVSYTGACPERSRRDNDSRVSGITYTAGSTQLGNLTYAYDAAERRTARGAAWRR